MSEKKKIHCLCFLCVNVSVVTLPVSIWASVRMIFELLVVSLESLLAGAGVRTDVKNSWGVFCNALLFPILRLAA